MTFKRLILMLLLGLLGLWSLTLFSTSTASAGPLPPRPTPGSTPIVTTGQATGQGASIELQVPGARSIWWTAVQWQDAQKNWNTVLGWQGSFDEIKSGTGSKLWWVAPADLGKGPFRWVIYTAKDGQFVTASEAFNLPAKAKTKLIVSAAVP